MKVVASAKMMLAWGCSVVPLRKYCLRVEIFPKKYHGSWRWTPRVYSNLHVSWLDAGPILIHRTSPFVWWLCPHIIHIIYIYIVIVIVVIIIIILYIYHVYIAGRWLFSPSRRSCSLPSPVRGTRCQSGRCSVRRTLDLENLSGSRGTPINPKWTLFQTTVGYRCWGDLNIMLLMMVKILVLVA